MQWHWPASALYSELAWTTCLSWWTRLWGPTQSCQCQCDCLGAMRKLRYLSPSHPPRTSLPSLSVLVVPTMEPCISFASSVVGPLRRSTSLLSLCSGLWWPSWQGQRSDIRIGSGAPKLQAIPSIGWQGYYKWWGGLTLLMHGGKHW